MTIEELQEYKNGKKFSLQEPTSKVVTKLMKEYFSKTESEQLKEWKKAFSYWNVYNSPYKGAHCRRCYGEVYNYLKEKELIGATYLIEIDPYQDDSKDFYPKISDIKLWSQTKKLTLWQKIKKLWS